MSFLLDTNIVSFHLRRPSQLVHRLVQHSGRLNISAISLGELLAWGNKLGTANRIIAGITEFVRDVPVLPFDEHCAECFGKVRAEMMSTGHVVPAMDMLIATTALAHDLTLVTNNAADLVRIPNLRVVDWTAD